MRAGDLFRAFFTDEELISQYATYISGLEDAINLYNKKYAEDEAFRRCAQPRVELLRWFTLCTVLWRTALTRRRIGCSFPPSYRYLFLSLYLYLSPVPDHSRCRRTAWASTRSGCTACRR